MRVSHIVVPAEAGTSGGKGTRKSPEIPASAGMTRGEIVA
jgi:hypothetical protein